MTMTDERKNTLERLGKVLPLVPDAKLEYLIGIGETIATMREEMERILALLKDREAG